MKIHSRLLFPNCCFQKCNKMADGICRSIGGHLFTENMSFLNIAFGESGRFKTRLKFSFHGHFFIITHSYVHCLIRRFNLYRSLKFVYFLTCAELPQKWLLQKKTWNILSTSKKLIKRPFFFIFSEKKVKELNLLL